MDTRISIARMCNLIIALFALFLIPSSRLRAADAPPKSPELNVLERFVGDWTTEGTVTVLNAQPQDLKTTGTATRKWILDGRLIEESGASSDGTKAKVLFTYDVAKKVYRNWYFSSVGDCFDTSGQWNEATQTFSFRTDLGNGFTQTSTIHFTDADHHEWSSKVTDAAGKVYFEGGGKLKRKK